MSAKRDVEGCATRYINVKDKKKEKKRRTTRIKQEQQEQEQDWAVRFSSKK
jgi:hypothetical protein